MSKKNERTLLDFSTTEVDTTDYVKDFDKAVLTTFDNPFDPFEDDLKWSSYDEQLGYYTNRRVARLIGEPTEFNDTGLGRNIEARLYYSTLLQILRETPDIPYVLAFPGDYTDGHYAHYTPSIV